MQLSEEGSTVPNMNTSKRELLERIYGDQLAADVARWVNEGRTWQQISDAIDETCSVRVSRVSLAAWYGGVAA